MSTQAGAADPTIVWQAAGLRIVAVGKRYTFERQSGADAMGVARWSPVQLPKNDHLERPDPRSNVAVEAYTALVHDLEHANAAIDRVVAALACHAAAAARVEEIDQTVPAAVLAAEKEVHAITRACLMVDVAGVDWDVRARLREARRDAERKLEQAVDAARSASFVARNYEPVRGTAADQCIALAVMHASARFGIALKLAEPEPEPEPEPRAPTSVPADDDHPTRESAAGESAELPIPPPSARPPLPEGIESVPAAL